MQHISAILFFVVQNFLFSKLLQLRSFIVVQTVFRTCRKTSSLNIVGFLKDGNFVVDKVPTFLYYLLVKNIVLFYN